jgi:hypothetical protein
MKVIDKVVWFAVACLIVSTAYAAGQWIISSPLIYHVEGYTISLTSGTPTGTIPNGTVISFTVHLQLGSTPADGRIVSLYNNETEIASGTTNASGLWQTQYTIPEIGDYNFTGRYQAP